MGIIINTCKVVVRFKWGRTEAKLWGWSTDLINVQWMMLAAVSCKADRVVSPALSQSSSLLSTTPVMLTSCIAQCCTPSPTTPISDLHSCAQAVPSYCYAVFSLSLVCFRKHGLSFKTWLKYSPFSRALKEFWRQERNGKCLAQNWETEFKRMFLTVSDILKWDVQIQTLKWCILA